MAVYDEGFTPSVGTPRITNLMNYAGAAVSLMLIVGVSIWGYQLIMRDVSGIPVVRAMEGDMRVLPENPGGTVAVNTGLAVNEVAAMGEAGGPEDRLLLAPRTSGLAQEDLDAQPMPAIAPDLEDVVHADGAAPEAVTDEIALLAAQLAGAAAPTFETVPDSVPGVTTSLRPTPRPATVEAAQTSAPIAPAATSPLLNEVVVTTTPFPAGTNLVQLGAFANPNLAAAEWERLQLRFGQIISGYDRVIQVSNQTSGTWYRLRASGFADRAEARRLCAALLTEENDCIAVVTK